MTKTANKSSLQELLDSAETEQDISAVADLLEEQEAARGDRWTVSSLGEVADLFGLSIHTVKHWRMETPPMPGSYGKWPIKEIIQWRLGKLANNDLATAKKQQDLELGQVQLEAKRFELAKDKGEYLERRDVELAVAQILIDVRENIMAIPEVLAISAPPELRDFVRSESDRIVRAALTNAARKADEFPSEIAAMNNRDSGAEDEPDGTMQPRAMLPVIE